MYINTNYPYLDLRLNPAALISSDATYLIRDYNNENIKLPLEYKNIFKSTENLEICQIRFPRESRRNPYV